MLAKLLGYLRYTWRVNFGRTGDVHVMLDIETLGTAPGCKVLQIGAVVFSPGCYNVRSFQAKISPGDQGALVADPATVKWWSEQDEWARNAVFGLGAVPLHDALEKFSRFLEVVEQDKYQFGAELPNVYIWGNGAGFDMPILAAAYRAMGLSVPWMFYNERCYRTLKNLHREVPMVIKPAVKHDAFEDALAQAIHAGEILNRSEHGWK